MNGNHFFQRMYICAKRFFQKFANALTAMILAFAVIVAGAGIPELAHAEGENPAHISDEKVRLAERYFKTAQTHHEQGDYAAALALYQKTLVIREEVLGNEHPDTAETYNHIGVIYYKQGVYPKAMEWYRKALSIRELLIYSPAGELYAIIWAEFIC